MVTIRLRTKHAKRALAGVFAACVAATAMAYSSGGLQHTHADEAPDPSKLRQHHAAPSGGGDQALETQDNGGDQGSTELADNGGVGGGGLQSPPFGPTGGAYGPGDNNESSGPGF